MKLGLLVEGKNGAQEIAVDVTDLVIAGWAARDKKAQEDHIRELEELGVARPTSTPTYYRVSATRLNQEPLVEFSGTASSGEVEPVLISSEDGLCVAVGSDHTDREVEAYGITVSKQMCDKPISSKAWLFEDVKDHWDGLVLRSYAVIDGERRLYQEGSISALLAPLELIKDYTGKDKLPVGTVLFGGTMPAIGGIKPGTEFECELEDPIIGRKLTLKYRIKSLPIVG